MAGITPGGYNLRRTGDAQSIRVVQPSDGEDGQVDKKAGLLMLKSFSLKARAGKSRLGLKDCLQFSNEKHLIQGTPEPNAPLGVSLFLIPCSQVLTCFSII